jgi:hypothetical protein
LLVRKHLLSGTVANSSDDGRIRARRMEAAICSGLRATDKSTGDNLGIDQNLTWVTRRRRQLDVGIEMEDVAELDKVGQ